MIMIPVDEADAFDRYAIAMIKNDDSASDVLWPVIALQLDGRVDPHEIHNSDEYKALLNANRETFNWVEKAKRNECSAQDVDRANYQRYLAKKALQEKFFPKSPLTETKTERQY